MDWTNRFPMRGLMFLAGAGCLTWLAASAVQAQGPGMGGMGKGGCGMGGMHKGGMGGCGMEMGMGGMHKGGMGKGGMGRPPMEMMGMGRGGMGMMPPGMGGMGMGRPPMEMGMGGMGRGGMGMMPPGMGGMGMAQQPQGIGGAGMLRPGGDLGAINAQNNFNMNQNFANQAKVPNQNLPKARPNNQPQDNVQQALMNRGKAIEARKDKLQRENDGANNNP